MFSVYHATRRDEALRALVLVEGDDRRLAAFRELYLGSHDLLDALWWRLHPLEISPRGVPDPAIERHALQRLAFSRHDEATPLVADRDLLSGQRIWLTDDELQLRNLDVLLAADARALDSAIAKFTAMYPLVETAEVAPVPVPPIEYAPPHASPVLDDVRQHAPWLPIAAGVLAMGLLVTTGAMWWRIQEMSDRLNSATPAASDPVRDWRETNATTLAALLIFNRSQTLDDVYPLQLPVAYDIRAVRQLTESDDRDGYRLFGALVEPDQICLAIVLADLSSSSSCVSDREFTRDGITIATHASRVKANDGQTGFVSHRITWEPDGSFTSSTG